MPASARTQIRSIVRHGLSILVVSLGVLFFLPGCEHNSTAPGENMSIAEIPNQILLDEVNRADLWFHAKKVRPIWAKQVDADQTVETLEGTETVKAGDYLCRGEIGEIWPQSASSLHKKYVPTDEIADGWTKFTPNPDGKGVFAAKVDHAFSVHASWGELSGKSGDFVVKNYDDGDKAFPVDVWIVDAALFEATYARTAESER